MPTAHAPPAQRTQEFDKNLSRIGQGVCPKLVLSAIATDPSEGNFSELGRTTRKGITTMNANIARADAKTTKVSKLRVAAAAVLAAVGLSILGSLMPAVASADPWVPFSGPLHPFRHYAADILHPVWAVTHPIRAAIP